MATEFLLDDAAMKRFLIEGFTIVETDFSPEFHTAVCQRIASVFERGGNPGNGIYEAVPALAEVYHHPAVHGALASLLGPDYVLHPHRHCHVTTPGSGGQGWHQDDVNSRHHQVWRVLAMYYPQDVTPEMGPTLIVPGTHFRNAPTSRMANYGAVAAQIALTVKAGTVVIAHYDIWHRASRNTSDRQRYMLKFLFDRTRPPERPSWNADPKNLEAICSDFSHASGPVDSATDAYKHRVLWTNAWKWLHGVHDRTDSTVQYYP
jgi:hypothetical protein